MKCAHCIHIQYAHITLYTADCRLHCPGVPVCLGCLGLLHSSTAVPCPSCCWPLCRSLCKGQKSHLQYLGNRRVELCRAQASKGPPGERPQATGKSAHWSCFLHPGPVYWDLTRPMFVLQLRTILCMILPRDRLGLAAMQEISLYWSGMTKEGKCV